MAGSPSRQELRRARPAPWLACPARPACPAPPGPSTGDELVATEIIFGGTLAELEPEEAVALLSALVFQVGYAPAHPAPRPARGAPTSLCAAVGAPILLLLEGATGGARTGSPQWRPIPWQPHRFAPCAMAATAAAGEEPERAGADAAAAAGAGGGGDAGAAGKAAPPAATALPPLAGGPAERLAPARPAQQLSCATLRLHGLAAKRVHLLTPHDSRPCNRAGGRRSAGVRAADCARGVCGCHSQLWAGRGAAPAACRG